MNFNQERIKVSVSMYLGLLINTFQSFYYLEYWGQSVFAYWGTYSLIVMSAVVLASHNNGQTVIRLLGRFKKNKNKIVNISRKLTVKISAIISIIIVPILYFFLDFDIYSSFLFFFILLFNSFFIIELAIARVERRSGNLYILYYILKPIMFFLLTVACQISEIKYLILVELIISLIVFILCYKKAESTKYSLGLLNVFKSKNYKIYSSTITQQLLTNLDSVILAFFFGVETVAIYILFVKISKAMIIGNKIVNDFVAPIFVNKNISKQDMYNVYIKSCFFSLITFLLPLILFLFVQNRLFIYFNLNYIELDKVFYCIIIGQLFNSASGPTGVILNMIDKSYLNTISNLVGLVLFLLTCIFISNEELLGLPFLIASLFVSILKSWKVISYVKN